MGTSLRSVGLVFRACPKVSALVPLLPSALTLPLTSRPEPKQDPSADSSFRLCEQPPCTVRTLSSNTHFQDISEHGVPTGLEMPLTAHRRTSQSYHHRPSSSSPPRSSWRSTLVDSRSLIALWLLSKFRQIVEYLRAGRTGRRCVTMKGRREERVVLGDDSICVERLETIHEAGSLRARQIPRNDREKTRRRRMKRQKKARIQRAQNESCAFPKPYRGAILYST